MTATFQISDSANNSFDLTTQGQVLDTSGSVIGTWTTDATNQIVIQKGSAEDEEPPAPIAIPAHWKFNDKNQFCVEDSTGNELLNFNTAIEDNFPYYQIRNAALRICPEDTGDFKFVINLNLHL